MAAVHAASILNRSCLVSTLKYLGPDAVGPVNNYFLLVTIKKYIYNILNMATLRSHVK